MAISGQKQGNSGSDKPVQDRLLDAAEQLFSEHGFDGASVRDIASAAGCNIAAVNYYFGGKDKLYTEVWRRQLVQMRDTRLKAIEQVMSICLNRSQKHLLSPSWMRVDHVGL
ncbi:MAG: TetR/AcrR family transcriptional regulator [Planctomycetota bacterium]|jgi:AcrR family transcriptional regulator